MRAAVAVDGVPVVAGLGRELHPVAALARAAAGAAVGLERACRRAAVAVDGVVIVAGFRPLLRAVDGVPAVPGLGRELHPVAALARAAAGAAVGLERACR